ncbi:fimbrial protein [Burkholderia gladioli]|uniref:fimbrial protein n=1 Tax=Burkholderia gladioli TaxID=28095 RepID=UPI00163FACCC|nr:fimbrial protein [Burkholderia gladioli]
MKKQLLLACLLAGMSIPAWAIRCMSDTNDSLNYYIAHVSGFTPPDFDPGTVPIGGVIYRSQDLGLNFINKRFPSASFECTEPLAFFYKTGIGVPNDRIYPTSIPNIGMRLSTFPGTGSINSTLGAWDESFPITIELVKTGEITAGGYLSGAYAQYRANTVDGQLMVEFRFASPVKVQPRIPTCRVATPQVTVPMGTMTTAMFTGIGSTTFSRRFDLALACSGGYPGTSTNAWVTLTDASQPGNTSTTLSLTQNSSASGIGIQIRHDDTVLGFGPDSATVGNTNQWFLGRIDQGMAEIRVPLTARYVQTGARVGAGSANARATFTLSYQ